MVIESYAYTTEKTRYPIAIDQRLPGQVVYMAICLGVISAANGVCLLFPMVTSRIMGELKWPST